MSQFSTPFVRPEPEQSNNLTISPIPSVGPERWRTLGRYLNTTWVRCLVLVFIGVVVRIPALQGERLWDDQYLANANPFIKSPALVLEAFRHYLYLDSFSIHYRPVQNISYMADYFFWNTNEFGYHLTNVLLHAGGGVLLFFLLRRLIVTFFIPTAGKPAEKKQNEQPWISLVAFLVALIWMVHPVHSAAIDYISGRADSLAFLFAASAWLLFLRGNRSRNRLIQASYYLLAGLCGLLALCSREIAIVWIVLFLVHVLFVHKPNSLRLRILIVVCSLAIVAAYAGLRQLPGQRPIIPSVDQWSAPVRATLMVRALGDYGRLMVFPWNLHMERTVFDPGYYLNNASWRDLIALEYLSVLGLVVIGCLIFGCVRSGPGRTLRCFGAFWFLAGYLPVSNIVQLNATVAEHWLYLPSVGLLLFVAGWVIDLSPRYQRMAVMVAIFATGALSVRSFIRSTDWVTPETFYRRTIAAGGVSARTGLNLAQIYANRNDYADAEIILRRVIAAVPNYPLAVNNLASVLAREGKNQEAEKLFATLEKNTMNERSEYPQSWVGALNLAGMRHNAKNNKEALAIIDRVQVYFPEVWELIRMKSEILRETKGPDEALRLVEKFAATNWWHQGAALAIGRLYAQRGNADLAEQALRRASWLDIHDTEAIALIVQMRLRQNKLADAVRLQRRAISRQPDEPRQYTLLSDILQRMGRRDEAQAALAEAARLRELVHNQVAAN